MILFHNLILVIALSIAPSSLLNATTHIQLPPSDEVLVLRTDFSSNKKWEDIVQMIKLSGEELNFQANVVFCNERRFEGFQMSNSLDQCYNYRHHIILIVDSTCISHYEHPILCVDLFDNPGKSFRFIPAETWAVENNLSMANMDFDEFYVHTDEDGIFRGI